MYKILHLEDVASDAELAARELKKSHIEFEQCVVDTEAEYTDALEHFKPDIILCDHSLASFNSREALAIFKTKHLNIPFILITATLSDEVAISILKDGADDYILKNHLQRLPNAVINAVEKNRLTQERTKMIYEAGEKEKLGKQRLADLSNKLLLATKSAGVGIWEFVIATRQFNADEMMLSLYGIHPGEFDHKYATWRSFIHPDDNEWMDKKFQNFLSHDIEFNASFRIIDASKTLHYIEASAIIERDHKGIPVRIVGTNQDVTKRKVAEQTIQVNTTERELLIAELTNSIKDLKLFTYITSHNLRGPLSNLTGLLSFIEADSLTKENSEIVGMLKVSTVQLNKTINDLLKILIIKNNVNVDITKNNISGLLAEVCQALSLQMNEIGCSLHQHLQVTDLWFNKVYLESILMNLVSNSIKYRSPDRPLSIDISTERTVNGDILMTVKDNGIGIDLKMHKDKIFGLYQRFHSNADSVGLGLFIVKSQINALGGSIAVESEVDKGTTFSILFKEKNA